MLDSHTKQPIQVLDDEATGPSIEVRLDRLDAVEKLLQAHGIPYWASEHAIPVDEEPAEVVVKVRKGVDPRAVQEILDRAA
jgi:hypothetical protein